MILSEGLIETLCEMVGKGYPLPYAGSMLGIPKKIINSWYNAGNDEALATKYQLDFNLCNNFVIRVNAAKASYLYRHIQTIDGASLEGDAKAAQWLLEKMDPQTFGQKDQPDLIKATQTFVFEGVLPDSALVGIAEGIETLKKTIKASIMGTD